MGVIGRVQSLPNLTQLIDHRDDVNSWGRDSDLQTTEKYEEDFEEDLKSVTSTTSEVEDIMAIIREKAGRHTVHGTNVWALMKAAADARALEFAEVKVMPLEFGVSQEESDDMWYWPAEEGVDDAESDDLWDWQPEPKVKMLERLEQRIADEMWDWGMWDPMRMYMHEEPTEGDEEATAKRNLAAPDRSVESALSYWASMSQFMGKQLLAGERLSIPSDLLWDWSPTSGGQNEV